jgi:GNAT superfamily N-acetyltransferase
MYKIINSNIDSIYNLRQKYILGLRLFQELFLEHFIEESKTFCILEEETIIGYCLVSNDDLILEFWVDDSFKHTSGEILKFVVKGLQVKGIYCKSFDTDLLMSCLSNRFDFRIIGCLYRDIDRSITYNNLIENKLQIEFATQENIISLADLKCELISSLEELLKMVNQNNLIIFRSHKELVGLGFLTKILIGYNFFDIGVWVAPKYRSKGYGKYIISYLKEYCLNNELTPICGCDIDNLASQKIIESNGFIPLHKLLIFSPG